MATKDGAPDAFVTERRWRHEQATRPAATKRKAPDRITTSTRADRAAIAALLSPGLAKSLRGIDVSGYFANEVEALRVATRALPRLSAIEEVYGTREQAAVDKSQCERLYVSSFPKADEREDPALVQARREDMDKLRDPKFRKQHRAEWTQLAERYGDSRFHHVALVDLQGRVVGQRQFSVVPVGDDAVAVYSQYSSVASKKQMQELYGATEDMQRHGLLTLLHAMSLAIAQHDAALTGRTKVVGTFFESEMKGDGATAEDIAYTYERLDVHNKVGAKAMLLEMKDGSVLTPHCQPALGEEARAILLHFMVRFPKYSRGNIGEVVRWSTPEEMALARDMVESFFANFAREGFAQKDIDAARALILQRFDNAVAVVFTPPAQTPDMLTLAQWDPALRAQIEAEYGGLAQHAKTVEAAVRSFEPSRRSADQSQ